MTKNVLTVAEQLMHSTVRIECRKTDNTISTGTGFFFKFLDDGQSHVPVIVTNKHIIEGSVTGAFHITRAKGDAPDFGNHLKCEIENFAGCWLPHPKEDIDLAIFPVGPILNQASASGTIFFWKSLDPSLIPKAGQIEDLTGMDSIVMIGYPNGLWDSKNNMPILRSGSTATHPKLDYEGKPIFLIDCACFPGSSGSPVMVYDPAGYRTRSGDLKLGQERLLLLGVLFAGPQHMIEGRIKEIDLAEFARVSKSFSQIPNNLGFVIKSSALSEFEPLLEKRRKQIS